MMEEKPENAGKNQEVGKGKPPKDTRFKKGQSGNPKGKPKGTLSLVALLKRLLEECPEKDKRTYAELFVRKLVIHKALNEGDTQAMKEILNRVDGAVSQGVDLTSGGEKIYNWGQYGNGNNNNLSAPFVDKATPRG